MNQVGSIILQWRIQGKAHPPCTPPPPTGPDAFVFIVFVFMKYNRLGSCPPTRWTPPKGNPESATALDTTSVSIPVTINDSRHEFHKVKIVNIL